MFQIHLYKLFNPDLNHLSNPQLLQHWNKFGKNEDRINSFESFFKKYPYYDHDSYKLYNNDIKINDKIELMTHWHLYGIKEDRICSDKYFNSLYPDFEISYINQDYSDDIYIIKNKYHKQKDKYISKKEDYIKLENSNICELTESNKEPKINNSITFFENINIENINIKLKISLVFYIPSKDILKHNNNDIINSNIAKIFEYKKRENIEVLFIFIKDIYSNKDLYDDIKHIQLNNESYKIIILETQLIYNIFSFQKYLIEFNKNKNNNDWIILIPDILSFYNLNEKIFSIMESLNIYNLEYIIFKINDSVSDNIYAISKYNIPNNISNNNKINIDENIILSGKKTIIINILEGDLEKSNNIYNDTKSDIIKLQKNINNPIFLFNNTKTAKNIIVKLENNFQNDIIKIIIGLIEASRNKFNFYISNIKVPYKLFDNFKIATLNDIKNSVHLNLKDDKDFELKYNNFILNDNYFMDFLNNGNFQVNKVKQNNIINYFNLSEKINVFKYKINILNPNIPTLGIYISECETNTFTNTLTNTGIESYFKKVLAGIPFHNMNVIVFCENDYDNIGWNDELEFKIKENSIFLKNIKSYFRPSDIILSKNSIETDFLLLSLCDYIITYSSHIPLYASYFGNIKKLYYHYSFENYVFSRNLLTNNIIFCDEYFDNMDSIYLNGNILVTPFKNYFYKDKIINIPENYELNIDLLSNVLYIHSEDININLYDNDNKKNYTNYLKNDIRIIKINDDNGLNYGVYYDNNNYYFRLNNNYKKYTELEFEYIKKSLPWDINYVYVQNSQDKDIISYENRILIENNFIEFKFNIIFIIDEKDNLYAKYLFNNFLRILESLNESQYINFNIIIFFNGVSNSIFLKDKFDFYRNLKSKSDSCIIYYLSCEIKKTHIEILYHLTKLSDDNSIILYIDNNHPLDPRINLKYINNLFFVRKLLFTNYYTNQIYNIIFYKKEILCCIPNNHIELMENIEDILYYLKNITFNYYCQKLDLNLEDKQKNRINQYNKYILNNQNMSIYYNIIYDYQLINYYKASLCLNFSDEKISYINGNNKSSDKKNNIETLDFIIDFYNKNLIDYKYFIKNFLYRYEVNSKQKPIQLIIFIHDFIISDEVLKIVDFVYNIHYDMEDIIQINVIHFGFNQNNELINNENSNIEKIRESENKKCINYYFIDNNYLNSNYKYNRAFANNLMIYILCENQSNNEFIYFYNIESPIQVNIFKYFCINDNILDFLENNPIIELSNNNILSNYSSLIIKKDLFNSYINFDPEIFLDYSGYEILYFLEKIRVKCDVDVFKYLIEQSINSDIIINDFFQSKLDKIYIYKEFYSKIIDIFINLDKTNLSILYKYLNCRLDININKKQNLWNKIDTHIINLDTRKDRYEEIYKELQKIGLYNYSRFPAIYPELEDVKKSNLINPNKLWKKKNIEYLRSASGCKMSHLQILKDALLDSSLNNICEYIMIIEDDVVFLENTEIYLSLALNDLIDIDWDILYLGTNLKKSDDAIKISDNLLKIKKGLTTTAQLFKRSSLKMIINIIESSDAEIDNTYNDLLEDKYCVYPMCVYQRASYSDINKSSCDYGEFHRKYFY